MKAYDAEVLNQSLIELENGDNECWTPAEFRDYLLENQKVIEVEPVEYAHWIEINYGTIAECSKCFDMFDVIDTDSIKTANKAFDNFCTLYNYCPNCGRKMIRENEDVNK